MNQQPVDYPIPNVPQMPIAKAERMARAERMRGRFEGAIWAIAIIPTVIVLASAALGQGFYTCTPPDRITIADDGPGRAIVTFYNSINDCSNNIDRIMTTDNGISVRVIIKVGSAENDYRESIALEPQDPMMMAYPPEGDLLDGEERRFVIQGGSVVTPSHPGTAGHPCTSSLSASARFASSRAATPPAFGSGAFPSIRRRGLLLP